MTTPKAQRSVNLDIIRCVALLSIVCTHFLLKTGFYDQTVSGPWMFVMCLMRAAFSVCVPLFLLLTGYLMRSKRLEKAYFFKISKTLVIYILASIVCLLYQAIFQREDFSFIIGIYGFFSFATAPYSWYIEMYLGLFLLIPFLNILYNNLGSQKHKQLLLLILLCSTALPGIINIHCVFDLQWWQDPVSSTKYYMLIPDWWEGIYPLTYYFIGCYLSEYPIRIQRSRNALGILLSILVFGSFTYYRSYGAVFQWGKWQDYGSAFVAVLSILVFLFFLQLDCSKLGEPIKKWFARCSDWSLGAYLVSWVFDTTFYPLLCGRIPLIQARLPWFFLIVPIVLVCSLALSALLNLISKFLHKHLFPKLPLLRQIP